MQWTDTQTDRQTDRHSRTAKKRLRPHYVGTVFRHPGNTQKTHPIQFKFVIPVTVKDIFMFTGKVLAIKNC